MSSLVLQADASVVMQGTRVIVVAGMKEKSIQFSNASDRPFIVQASVSLRPGQTDETDELPFLLAPPIFKINPRSGQTVRLMILPTQEPSDVEEVYYLNFSQVPAITTPTHEANRLVILMNTTVKIFYRPAAIKEGIADIAKRLIYKVEDGKLSIENPTPFHVSINAIQLESGAKTIPVDMSPQMIPPRASKQWMLDKPITAENEMQITLVTINDYGAEVLTTVPLMNK